MQATGSVGQAVRVPCEVSVREPTDMMRQYAGTGCTAQLVGWAANGGAAVRTSAGRHAAAAASSQPPGTGRQLSDRRPVIRLKQHTERQKRSCYVLDILRCRQGVWAFETPFIAIQDVSTYYGLDRPTVAARSLSD